MSLEVGIIMGSDSDLPTMKDAIAICADFGIETETPEVIGKLSMFARMI